VGVWGTGLYSSDFAMDLRTTIAAVARLPFDADRIVEILCQVEPGPAGISDDADHSTFWLVVADQMAKRSMLSAIVRDRAIMIIDRGTDLLIAGKLGMSAAALTKRRKMLLEVRARLVTPPPAVRPRTVLKKPQPLLMDVGEVFVYPTFNGKCINPYYRSKELDNKHWTKEGPAAWRQNGWSAMIIVDRGRAFDFLSWYRPLTLFTAVSDKPDLGALRGKLLWKLSRAGTCSALHFKRLELEKVAGLPIDAEKLRRAFPNMKAGISAAVSDISISNGLQARPANSESNAAPLQPQPSISEIGQILSGEPAR